MYTCCTCSVGAVVVLSLDVLEASSEREEPESQAGKGCDKHFEWARRRDRCDIRVKKKGKKERMEGMYIH